MRELVQSELVRLGVSVVLLNKVEVVGEDGKLLEELGTIFNVQVILGNMLKNSFS